MVPVIATEHHLLDRLQSQYTVETLSNITAQGEKAEMHSWWCSSYLLER